MSENYVMTVTWVTAAGSTVTNSFDTSGAAWAFMRKCDTAGIRAGFPHAQRIN